MIKINGSRVVERVVVEKMKNMQMSHSANEADLRWNCADCERPREIKVEIAYFFLDNAQDTSHSRVLVALVDQFEEFVLQPPRHLGPKGSVIQDVSQASQFQDEANHQQHAVL